MSETILKKALVTGAGSGVGQAIAVRLAAEGWQVALVGRRAELLHETAALVKGDFTPTVHPCDISQSSDVEKLAAQVGEIEVLINAAGTNIPNRSLEKLSLEDYRKVLETNLSGAFLCVQAFLPGMRARRSGTIVNVVSDAGLRANAKAGVAYVASKFGMSGLTQSINAEERANGIRACAIYPGDINTPILDLRPVPPPAEARLQMLQPEDVAECALLAINLPSRAIVEELVVRPR
jgi:NAD(P)-dependent dehydrogenase (short-subunit alcohol dehydrogenase family)